MDEFEEFRARANSGGASPAFDRRYRKQNEAQDMSTIKQMKQESNRIQDIFDTDGIPRITLKRPSTTTNILSFEHTSGSKNEHGDDKSNDQPKVELKEILNKEQMPTLQSHCSFDVLTTKISDGEWDLGEDEMRPRVSSMPSSYKRTAFSQKDKSCMPTTSTCLCGCHLRKVRSFAITPKGVVNEGDVYVTRSNPSLSSLDRCHLLLCKTGHLSTASSQSSNVSVSGHEQGSTDSCTDGNITYQVWVIGKMYVGKSTLVQRFTNEITTFQTSIGKFKTCN